MSAGIEVIYSHFALACSLARVEFSGVVKSGRPAVTAPTGR